MLIEENKQIKKAVLVCYGCVISFIAAREVFKRAFDKDSIGNEICFTAQICHHVNKIIPFHGH